MSFNKDFDFKGFRAEIAKALEVVENKYGVKFEQGNGSYNENTYSIKLTAIDSNVDLAKANFEDWSRCFGLRPEHYGREVTISGEVYKIVGINPKAKKYPIIVECMSDGKQYDFTVEPILNALNK